jgi:hypothetical protein
VAAEQVGCPRCGAAFHCGADEPQPCACSRITLDAATLSRLREQWRGCLCLDCLLQLQREAAAAGAPSA